MDALNQFSQQVDEALRTQECSSIGRTPVSKTGCLQVRPLPLLPLIRRNKAMTVATLWLTILLGWIVSATSTYEWHIILWGVQFLSAAAFTLWAFFYLLYRVTKLIPGVHKFLTLE